MSYHFQDLFDLWGKYAYHKAAFEKGQFKGKELPFAPNNHFSAGLDIALPYNIYLCPEMLYVSDAYLGNETLGLNLSIFLDVGLMSPILVSVDAPTKVNPGDYVNLKLGITGENSRFWGHFEGTIKLITPLGSTDVFSLIEIGIPEQVDFAAFKTLIVP